MMRPHLPPSAPAAPTEGEERGEVSVGVAVLCRRLSTIPRPQPRSPLSHAAGEEGGDDAPTPSPFRPCRSHRGRGKGGGERRCGGSVPASVNDTASTTQITPLPQRGRGAGGEGLPQRLTFPLAPFRSPCRAEGEVVNC
jgi:hypothetical protein